ncbi:MAG: GTP-binding protein [Methylobacterium sp.]|uniref:GTP-binding protein n=1 Tax=Methylobacterium sp. TaxID=409 RepID=UPI002590873D|nr:GTP-binding protein [Methylobacterium sp.]MBY0297569.1 GTP-binding protein [Methylobacterium sp.]
MRHRAERLGRLKGLVAVVDVATPVVQGVQHLIHPPLHFARVAGRPGTRLVAVLRDLGAALLRRSFAAFTGARPDAR